MQVIIHEPAGDGAEEDAHVGMTVVDEAGVVTVSKVIDQHTDAWSYPKRAVGVPCYTSIEVVVTL